MSSRTVFIYYPIIFPNFQNCACCEKDLKDNKDNSLHLGRKYARIFSRQMATIVYVPLHCPVSYTRIIKFKRWASIFFIAQHKQVKDEHARNLIIYKY